MSIYISVIAAKYVLGVLIGGLLGASIPDRYDRKFLVIVIIFLLWIVLNLLEMAQ